MSKTKTAVCKELIKDYCANCTVAGIHYIADENKHFTERLLWLILVILSWYGSSLLVISAWDAFIESPISFVVETTYIDWNTKMPTVAICETFNKAKIFNVSDTIWPPGHLLDLEDALKEIVYFRGVAYVLVGTCFLNPNPDPLCPINNYAHLANLVRSDCDTILKNCTYNDEEFPCCDYFQPIETDIGSCFILNSVQTKKPHPYPMVNNLKNNRGSIQFDVKLMSTMYTLGEDEVPTVTTLLSSTLKIQLGYSYRRILSVRNIENDPLITETTSEQRACRFPDENNGGLYPKYSYSACTVLCRKRAQFDQCKCYDHFMLGTTESERCNLSGIACLNSKSSHLTTLKPPWSTRPGLTCNCLPSCDETEITVIKDIGTAVKGKANKKKARVEIELAYLPTERFKRNVVRSRLDLVVSVGGTTGLFVGASLLSFVELFFFFTVRLVNNILKERKNRRSVVAGRSIDTEMVQIPEIEETERNIVKRDTFYKEPYLTSGVPNLYYKLYYKNNTLL